MRRVCNCLEWGTSRECQRDEAGAGSHGEFCPYCGTRLFVDTEGA
ncbi:hypothetical protein LCGC14_0702310 [marine sediment metagenome]|uniref:Uncharacterized protein n=1 Tax=marine sediment metagenome TaxID=412755 RepID=A0A0F9TQ48_9ZZZZ